eukprot:2556645-Rhodomonas_salina.1
MGWPLSFAQPWLPILWHWKKRKGDATTVPAPQMMASARSIIASPSSRRRPRSCWSCCCRRSRAIRCFAAFFASRPNSPRYGCLQISQHVSLR